MEDHSSSAGGFCLLEDNAAYFWDCGTINADYAAPARNTADTIVICGNGVGITQDDDTYCNTLSTANDYLIEEDRGGPVNIYWDRQVAAADDDAAKGSPNVFNQSNLINNNRFNFYRLSKADFKDKFSVAWENTALQCDKQQASASINKQDGRAYHLSMLANMVDKTDTNNILEYFDYPKCTYVGADSEHHCQLYTRKKDK